MGLEMGICENKHFLPISLWRNAVIAGTISEVNLWLWKQTTLIWRRPNTQKWKTMCKPEETTEESGLIHYKFDDNLCLKISQMAEDILKSYDGIDDAYKGMDFTNQYLTAQIISRRTELHPLQDELLKQRIKLHLEIKHAEIIGAHHFAKASAECIDTYRSGFFVACTMMTQSINEGIVKFVAKRNSIKIGSKEHLTRAIDKLKRRNLLTHESAMASKAIWRSYRNAIHHMREDITKIQDWHELAKQNLRSLAKVESCVFGFELVEGAMRLHFPQHWDNVDENLVQTWLRLN